MGAKLKRFDKEFREKAIKLALSSSQPMYQTAKDLGIKEATLYSWVKNKRNADIETHGEEGKNFHDELARLRKENARLKEEREILKKAAAFFAKESQ
jgi:transposase